MLFPQDFQVKLRSCQKILLQFLQKKKKKKDCFADSGFQWWGQSKRVIQSLVQKASDMFISDNPITEFQISFLSEYPEKSLTHFSLHLLIPHQIS